MLDGSGGRKKTPRVAASREHAARPAVQAAPANPSRRASQARNRGHCIASRPVTHATWGPCRRFRYPGSRDSLARRTVRIVVDVFGSRELPTDCRESLDAAVREVQDRPERCRIGKQQTVELVFLNIGKHPSSVRITSADLLHQAFFQHFDRPISLVAKAVEVDQRRQGTYPTRVVRC